MYYVDANNVIHRVSDGKVIVRDVNSPDYQAYVYAAQFGNAPGNGKTTIIDQSPGRDRNK